MKPNKIEFELKNDLSELDTLAEKLEAFSRLIGMDDRCLFEINLAMDELFTNIVSYGFSDKREHRVRVSLVYDADTISITLEDDGAPFNPLFCKMPDLNLPVEKSPVGGLGIHLCRSMMDEMEYQRAGNRNIITLRKRKMPKKNQSEKG